MSGTSDESDDLSDAVREIVTEIMAYAYGAMQLIHKSMNKYEKQFTENVLDLLRTWREKKLEEGLVPTADLLIEELSEKLVSDNK